MLPDLAVIHIEKMSTILGNKSELISNLERSAVLKRRHAGRAAVDHGGGGRGGRAGRIGRLAAAGPGDRRAAAATAAAAAQLLVDLARLGVVLDVLHLGGLARVDGY